MLAYWLSMRNPHGVFVGTWRFTAEVVFRGNGVYFGARQGPRSTGGLGYDIGSSLENWEYLSRIGGTATRQWLGIRWSTAPFFTFVLSIPWWIMGSFVVLLWVPLALTRRRDLAGTCRACGYDLRATPSRCPECGTDALGATEGVVAVDMRAAFWLAAVAASLAAMDFFLAPRERLPPYVDLIYAVSLILSLGLLGSGYWLARQVDAYGAWTLLLLLFSAVRALVPRLNH